MSKRPLATYFSFYVVITLLSLLVISWYGNQTFRTFYIKNLTEDLKNRSYLFSSQIEAQSLSTRANEIDALCKSLGKLTFTRFTVVDNEGNVLGDTDRTPATMDNHSTRPEINRALVGIISSNIRYSKTLTVDLLYVSLPIKNKGEIVGAVRAAVPLTTIDEELALTFYKLFLVGLLITAFLSIVSLFIFRRISRPLEDIHHGAERFAKGHFETKLPSFEISEINDLSISMNIMAAKLKHLEQVRRDFVANVSHELKTPVTSIKGFVETLLDGALEKKEEAQKFLEIISRQAERLTSIIEDLLVLSKLESENVDELLLLHETSVNSMLASVKEACGAQAEDKNINVTIECPKKLSVLVDRSLMEQALFNLVENAIKYSEPSKSVRINVKEETSSVKIHISDEGPGIAPEHISRLFERFYRVDKARSRNLGGTGLGLAIVKHVAGVHGGSIDVSSEVGRGSTFSIQLKKPQ